jgi:hypothetical protein
MGAYSNPKWYGGDPLAFTKGFEKSFSENYASAESYFQQKIENRKKYLEGVDAQMDKMREEREAAEAAGQTFQEDIQTELNAFYNAATKVDKQDASFFGQLLGKDVKETRFSKQAMDKATNSFNVTTNTVNSIADRALGEFDQELDFDHDNPNYRLQQDLIKAFKSYKKGGDTSKSFKYNFNEDEGVFEFSMDVPEREYDPATGSYKETGKTRTVSSSEIISMIQDLSPEDRATYETTKSTTITSLANSVKTEIEQKYALGTANLSDGEKAAYTASYNSRQIVEDFIEETSVSNSEREGDGFDLVTKMYANSVDYNDAKRVSILKTKFPDLVARFEGSPNSLDSLELILNSSPSDQASIENILNKVQDKNGNNIFKPEELQGALKNINEGFKEITKEYLVDELAKEGIGSKVAKGDPLKIQGNSGNKTVVNEDYINLRANDTKKTYDVTEKTILGLNLLPASALEVMGGTFKTVGGEFALDPQVASELGGETVLMQNLEEVKNTFINREFIYKGSKRNVSDMEFDADGNISLFFEGGVITEDIIGTQAMYDSGQINKKQIGKKVGEERVQEEYSTLSYNIYNPESMRNFMDATSTEVSGSGKEAQYFVSTGFNKSMVPRYSSTPSQLRKLTEPKMAKWKQFVIDESSIEQKKQMFDMIKNTPSLLESPAWAGFITKYSSQFANNQYN